MATPDMDVIKEIPGYKVILKAVLKSQIQQLVEQLASHTDEESVILTASVSDGTLSHLGSDSGKNFLDDHEDIKSQFLGFCLKRHHKKKVQQQMEEQQKAALQMQTPPWPTHLGPGPGHRPRLSTPGRQSHPRHTIPRHPMSGPAGLGKSVRHEPYPTSKPRRSIDSNLDLNKSVPSSESSVSSPSVKLEPEDPSQNSQNDGESSPPSQNPSGGPSTPREGSDSNDPQTSSELDPNINVKVEAITEGEMELEITGVELGSNSDPTTSQPMNLPLGFDPSGAMGSPADLQAGYSVDERRKFPCDICGKAFLTKQHKERHRLIHTGERPYQCKICLRAFRQESHRKAHMMQHYSVQ